MGCASQSAKVARAPTTSRIPAPTRIPGRCRYAHPGRKFNGFKPFNGFKLFHDSDYTGCHPGTASPVVRMLYSKALYYIAKVRYSMLYSTSGSRAKAETRRPDDHYDCDRMPVSCNIVKFAQFALYHLQAADHNLPVTQNREPGP